MRWSTWLSSLDNIGLVKKFVQVMEKMEADLPRLIQYFYVLRSPKIKEQKDKGKMRSKIDL